MWVRFDGWMDGWLGWDKMVYYEYEHDKKRQFEVLDYLI
jgi:hypothetical protein